MANQVWSIFDGTWWLHENERIWPPGGGARPWRPPLDPPMIFDGTWWAAAHGIWYI